MKRDSLREQLNETEQAYRDLQSALLALDLSALQERYVSAKDVQADLQRRRAELKDAFDALPGRLAGRLVGLSAGQIERVLDHEIRAAMTEVAQLSAASTDFHAPTPQPGEVPQTEGETP